MRTKLFPAPTMKKHITRSKTLTLGYENIKRRISLRKTFRKNDQYSLISHIGVNLMYDIA